MFRKALTFTIIFTTLLALSSVQTDAGSCSPVFPATTCSVSDDVVVTATVPSSTATFTGLAPASSVVTIKTDGAVSGTTVTNSSGVFSKSVIGSPGVHDFALYLTDTSGRTTPETVFNNVTLINQLDTPINNILLSPTIELSKTSMFSGESVNIFGQGSPGSTIHIILNGSEIYSSVIGSGSDYSFASSSGYSLGNNSIYSFLTRSGYTDSINSFTQNLALSNCRRSDLNCDGHVNLTDFSILMYWWDSAGPTGDTNHDGKVGLIDFSIMLFDWTD
ncbi:MAG TPA: hypothetical protein VLE47_00720 [Candidatus Saccharimonadales bacterium]|nr:hypothetical protein [Candidatus Saccharimonadales bacterium]